MLNRTRSPLAALATAALLFATTAVGSTPATAVTGADFNPGFIISDAVFYNSGAMSVAQIQDFINSKGARCVAGAGNTCLKDYRESTNTIPGDSYCASYQGANSESAAQIIAKVAAACNINPQVLLVTLQKEQGLVTSSTGKPAATFRRALGYGCPDNAGGWCDPNYAGFFVQMQRAARQFQVYRSRPTSYQYVAGKWNTIQYNPNAACGTSQVLIQNQATAALYIYTPYVPNTAALNAGYGSGDGCSSYGNRNFFLYFNDWFGSSGFGLSSYILNWYLVAANRAMAGEVTSPASITAGGIKQSFQNGAVYVSGMHGVHFVPAGLLSLYYDSLNGPAGVLGFPMGSHTVPGGGLSQPFQNGTVFISGGTGFKYVSGWVLSIYQSNNGPTGPLGFPTTLGAVNAGGLTQSFQGGTIWISGASGVHILSPAMQAAFVSYGGPGGALGFPTASASTAAGITTQPFQKGAIYTDGTTTGYVAGWMFDIFRAQGGVTGSLGLPTSEQRIEAGGIVQAFTNATVYISGVGGIQTVPSIMQAAYAATKGPAGPLGFPTSAATTTGAVTSQRFQGGTLYSDGVSAWSVANGIMADIYASRGGPTGSLGLPIEHTKVVGGGLVQAFAKGTVYVSGMGGIQTIASGSPVETYYRTLAGPTGTLSWPSGPQSSVGGGIVQTFINGTMYISGGTGFNYTTGWMGDLYRQAGGPTGPLGFPTNSTHVEAGGIVQSFQTATIYIAGATGIQTVPLIIQNAYTANGGPSGVLGFPIASAMVSDAGTSQRFQGGIISVTPAGVVTVSPG